MILILFSIAAAVSVSANYTCCDFQSILDSGMDELAEAPLNQLAYYFGVLIFHDLYLYPSAPSTTYCSSPPLWGHVDNTTAPNIASPVIDGSFIYGNTPATRAALRTYSGGRLNISIYDELSRTCNAAVVPKFTGPYATESDITCAGDPRNAETLQLLALQTLWVMEHNRHADRLAANKKKKLDDEAVFLQARQVVVGLLQKIALYEWLPSVVGRSHRIPPWAPPAHDGIEPLAPSALPAFTQAWIPFFASGANNRVLYSDQNQELTSIPLADGFYNPADIHRVLGASGGGGGEGVCTVLTGLLRDPLQRLGPSLAAGFAEIDVAARACSGARRANVTTFAMAAAALVDGMAVATLTDVTRNPYKLAKARALYPPGTTDEEIATTMDLTLGLMLEDHGPADDDVMGPVGRALLLLQMVNYTRNPDIYWYENPASPAGMKGRRRRGVKLTTLAEIISRNCRFVESLDGGNEFHLWAVSDVKVVVENNNNLNKANMATVWTLVALVIVAIVVLLVIVIYYFIKGYKV